MTLFMVPSMYLIAERLRRPMRRHWGGKWVSFLGIPPFTFLFLVLVIITMIRHYFEVNARRRRQLSRKGADETWVRSWF
jgi:hypothetical protein